MTEGGTQIDDLTLGPIAGGWGAAGGGIYGTAPGTIRGAMGGWAFPVGNFANANNQGKKCDGTTNGPVDLALVHPVIALWFLPVVASVTS